MDAYQYTVNSRIANLSNNQTMIEAVSKDGVQDILTREEFSGMLKRRRRKRQTVTGTCYNQFNGTLYSLVQPDGSSKTAITVVCEFNNGFIVSCFYSIGWKVSYQFLWCFRCLIINV